MAAKILNNSALGTSIRRIRLSKGYTQEEVVAGMHCSAVLFTVYLTHKLKGTGTTFLSRIL